MPSSVQAAKDNLYAMLAADSTLAGLGVQVSYAAPGPNVQQLAVWLGRVTSTEDPSQLGQRKRREDYVIELLVSVARDGDDAQACDHTASAIRDAVETILATPTGRYLNGAVSMWAEVVGFEWDNGVAPSGGQRVSEYVVKVGCSHRK